MDYSDPIYSSYWVFPDGKIQLVNSHWQEVKEYPELFGYSEENDIGREVGTTVKRGFGKLNIIGREAVFLYHTLNQKQLEVLQEFGHQNDIKMWRFVTHPAEFSREISQKDFYYMSSPSEIRPSRRADKAPHFYNTKEEAQAAADSFAQKRPGRVYKVISMYGAWIVGASPKPRKKKLSSPDVIYARKDDQEERDIDFALEVMEDLRQDHDTVEDLEEELGEDLDEDEEESESSDHARRVYTKPAASKESSGRQGKAKNNPWAICNSTLPEGTSDKKFERCVRKVKKKLHHKKSSRLASTEEDQRYLDKALQTLSAALKAAKGKLAVKGSGYSYTPINPVLTAWRSSDGAEISADLVTLLKDYAQINLGDLAYTELAYVSQEYLVPSHDSDRFGSKISSSDRIKSLARKLLS